MTEDIDAQAEKFKEQGNTLFKSGGQAITEAIEAYSKAIACKTPNKSHQSTYYSNRAAAYLKQSLYSLTLCAHILSLFLYR